MMPKRLHSGHIVEELKQRKEPSIVLFRKTLQGISNRSGCLGIFPASFNPPTLAHLALVRVGKREGNLDEILILLDTQAMDKNLIGARLEDRLIMLRMLFQKDSKVSIGLSNRGLFIEKLPVLRGLYPSPVEFTFIVGFDTILRVLNKKYYGNRERALDRLFEESRFLVANREDREGEAFERLLDRHENKRYRDRISFFTLPPKFSFLSSRVFI